MYLIAIYCTIICLLIQFFFIKHEIHLSENLFFCIINWNDCIYIFLWIFPAQRLKSIYSGKARMGYFLFVSNENKYIASIHLFLIFNGAWNP